MKDGRWRSDVIKITKTETHHYFVLCMDGSGGIDPALKDRQGRMMVFLNRNHAEQEAIKKWGKDVLVQIVGMGNEKWELFQEEMPFVLIEEEK